jgi:hypothetical protein
VIVPAEGLMLLPEKMIGFGRLKFALFAMLKNSARNSTRVLSVIGGLEDREIQFRETRAIQHSPAHVSPSA